MVNEFVVHRVQAKPCRLVTIWKNHIQRPHMLLFSFTNKFILTNHCYFSSTLNSKLISIQIFMTKAQLRHYANLYEFNSFANENSQLDTSWSTKSPSLDSSLNLPSIACSVSGYCLINELKP